MTFGGCPSLGQEEAVNQQRRPEGSERPEMQPHPPQILLSGARSLSMAGMEGKAQKGAGDEPRGQGGGVWMQKEASAGTRGGCVCS